MNKNLKDPDLGLRRILERSIKKSRRSRKDIGRELSEICLKEITKNCLDSWTAKTRLGKNRFPACYLAAFCKTTNSVAPIRMIARDLGFILIPKEDLIFFKMAKLEIQKEKAIKILLQGMRK